METQKYRIREGQRHYMREPGSRRGMACYTGGQIVNLTPQQARGLRDKLIPMSETPDKTAKRETAAPKEFYMKHSGAGKYNVYSATQPDKPLNENLLSKAQAEDAVKKLTAGEPVKLREDEDDDFDFLDKE